MREELLVGVGWLMVLVSSNYPVFDVNTQMRLLLVPADARIGSIIYRIRATDSDRDYPLQFDATDYGSYVVRLENLACNRSYSYCEANVYLERTLSPGQVFQFRVTVKDTRGDTTTLPATLHVTDARTDFEYVFPHIPGVINVPEDLPVGTELDYVVVRRNPRSIRPAFLELWGSPKFKFYQNNNKRDTTTGVIKLIEPLDYEEKSMYKLNIYATGMYVDLETDSRNIAGFPLVVVVTDIQDTPPVWDHIEPVTKLNKDIKKGDKVLTVTARDGDKGSPRRVKYGLVSENNPFTVFFTIDQDTGDISLVRELSELKSISVTGQPILLTVLAEEVVVGKGQPPAMSSTATVALLMEQLNNTPPYFSNQLYVAYLDENSIQGTQIIFNEPYVAEVKDNDEGKHGVFSLELQNNNGTFEISPTVAEREAQFVISVRDNKMLDYEVNKELSFTIVARELNPEGKALSSATNVTVYIRDMNDNPPVFIAPNYTATVPENITYGSQVISVKAMDVDTGEGGVIKYTHIFGDKNNSLAIHPESGLITIAKKDHGFDREQAQSYEFKVEARDGRGTGNGAIVPFLLKVLDVNDNAPQFDKLPMEFILGPDGTNFSQRAYITATDKDAEPPNNQVRYEIVKGNYGGKFLLDGETGELTVNPAVPRLRRQSTAKRNSTQQPTIKAQTNKDGTYSVLMRQSNNSMINKSNNEELKKQSPLKNSKPEEEQLRSSKLMKHSTLKNSDTKERQMKSEWMWESSLKNSETKDEVSARSGKSLQLTLLDSNLTEPMDNTTMPESRQAKRTPFVKKERQLEDSTTVLRVRAYDMGVPTQWREADVRIWPGQSGSRVLRFIVAGSNPDWRQVERMLSELTRGRVIIHDIIPYSSATNSYYQSYTDLSQGSPDSDKSIVTATVLYHSNGVIDLTSLSKNNRTKPLPSTQPPESVRIVRSESTVLFWVIILLLLLLLLLFLLLLLCCFCPGCPFYNYWTRKKTPLLQEKEHIAYISAPARDKENKSIQAEWAESARKEAWSPAVMSNRALRVRNTDQRVILMAPIDTMHRRQPSIIQLGSLQGRAQNDLILEDIDGTEYRIVDPARIAMRAPSLPMHERDDESLRRHEYERGSDRYESHVEDSVRDSYIRDKPPTRDQMFIRDGGAEILRLVTRGREDDRESEVRLNQPERPYTKEHRRHRDHGEHHRKDSEYTRDSYTEDYAKSQSRPRGSPYTKESKGSPGKEQSLANADVSRRHDFEKEHFGHEGNATEKGSVERGSLERGSLERGSLREKQHTHGGFATRESNPYITNRPYTNEDLKESSGKEVIMRRFIEDQVSSHSHRARLDEEERGHLQRDHELESSKDNKSLQSVMRTNNTTRKKESQQEDDDAAFKRIMNTRETLLTTADVNKLTTIQRDLLLARFLVEEQKRIVNRDSNVVDDTQSLPGGVVGVTMATQTDVDTGTQTDRIYFVKRRAKSDNDDSGSDDNEYHTGHRRFRKKKTIVVVDPDSVKPRRNRRLCETLKSPIMEESENIEIFNGFIPTKTSTLREAAIREKFNLREDRRHHHHHHHVPRAHQKETFYIMKSISDQDLHSITKHREDVLSSLEKTQVHKINIPNNIHREDLQYDERSKSSLSIHDTGADKGGNFQDITEVYRGAPESSISAPPTQRYLTDTISSLSKKSPTRYGEKKIVAVPQARYMDWYDKNIKTKDKPLVKKPSSSIQPKKRKVSDPVPKKRAIKRSDYEMIKRELLRTEKIPAFTIQPDDPLDSKQDSPQDRNNSKRNSIQINNQKPEDHDSGIAMPFASLPPAITAVTLPGDEQEEDLLQDDFVPMMNEKNDEMSKEVVLPPT